MPRPDIRDSRFLATGHLLEWLELLPAELQPDAAVYRRAARWLCVLLGEKPTVKTLLDFCPYVHAACAVRRLVGQGDD